MKLEPRKTTDRGGWLCMPLVMNRPEGKPGWKKVHCPECGTLCWQRPEDAGVIVEVAKTLGTKIPVLGVCLGHQAICAAFGVTVTYAKELMHGKQSNVKFDTSCPLFAGCPQNASVARYHSLAADPDTIPECLKVAALTEDGEIMAVWHKEYPIYGVQFHPESIMTPDGKQMIRNFIKEI